MQQLVSKREQDIAIEALESRAADIASTMFIGDIPTTDTPDRDYGLKITEAKWGQTGIPITLDVTVGALPPRAYENETIYFYSNVEGIPIQQLVGTWTASQTNTSKTRDATTEFLASSTGALLSRKQLAGWTEYQGLYPHEIIRDVVRRLPYDSIRIEETDRPLLVLTRQNGFKPQAKCSDVLSKVFQAVPNYIPFDTAFNGFECRLDRGLGAADDITRTFDAEDIPDWIPPTRATDLYSHVEVYQYTSDGLDYAFYARADIYYFGLDKQPEPDTPLSIELQADPENLLTQEDADNLARDLAAQHSRGLFAGQYTLPYFWPFIEKRDLMAVEEIRRDEGGVWNRRWLMGVTSYNHQRQASGYSTQVNFSATLDVEEKIAVPTIIVPSSVSLGVLSTPPPPYWREGDYLHFNLDELSWVTQVGDSLVFSDDAPATVSGDRLVFS